jgi:hypothetical protein
MYNNWSADGPAHAWEGADGDRLTAGLDDTGADEEAALAEPLVAAHCPIAANDFEPAMTAEIPTASSPAS